MKALIVPVIIWSLLSVTSCQHLPDIAVRTPAAEENASLYLQKGIYPVSKSLDNVLDKEGKVKVVFNLPPYINPGNAGIVKELLKTINEARHSVRMSVFQFNQAEVFQALENAAKRGVRIYIATDLCYSGKSGYKEYFDSLRTVLKSAGQNPDTQIVDDATASCDTMFNHNKYFIVDYEQKDLAKAWFGSFNPTNHGAVENVELAIVARSPEIAEILMLDFEQQLKGIFKVNKKGIYLLQKGDLNINTALSEAEIIQKQKEGFVISYPRVKIGDMQFEFILSPKVKSLTKIIESIYQSKKEVLFSSFAIADQMLISALINKSQSVDSAYNVHSILALPHPGESEGVVVRKNGLENVVHYDKKNASKKMDPETVRLLQTMAGEIKSTVATPVNYLTPKEEIKGIYRYFYPQGAAGGTISKVHVEGIFNSKVINEKTTYARLKAAGIPVAKTTLTGELHNKLFIIDEEKIIFGSHNFSQSAENSNDELTVIVQGRKLAKLLKEELFQKTKLFSQYPDSSESFTGKAKLVITEIVAESAFRYQQNKRVIDAGDYIEIHNLGEQQVNLLGFRIDDHYFPDHHNEVMSTAGNAGFLGTLVRFKPAAKAGELGFAVFDPEANILPARKTALIVGKYYHPDFYLQKFRQQFEKLHGRPALADDEPMLFTVGEYFASVLGDAATGLTSKDRITLFGIDGTTVIDRFAHPRPGLKSGQSLQREIDRSALKDKLDKRQFIFEEKAFSTSNGQKFLDTSFVATEGYSQASEWVVTEPTPGIVVSGNRAVAQAKNSYVINATVADVENNTWIKAALLIENGKIKQIAKPNSMAQTALISDVLLFPGLVDSHNHIKYNTMPVWISSKTYKNRDQWPEEVAYRSGVKEIYKAVYGEWPECSGIDPVKKDECLAKKRCTIIRYAELKSLLGGTTAVQGSSSFDETTSDITFRGLTTYTVGEKQTVSKARHLENLLDQCSQDGARNIEREKWRGVDEIRSTATSVYSDAWVRSKVSDQKSFAGTPSAKLLNEFASRLTNTFFVHLSEGVDEYSKKEWDELVHLKLNVPETTVIHGTALGESEFKAMAAKGQSLAWSPTSNLLLYGQTTNIPAALKNGVNVALGSDWSLSGTKSMLDEIKVARATSKKYFAGQISDKDILRMATINSARAAHLDNLIGSIDTGKLADYFIVDKSKFAATPLETLVKITESDISAVFVAGVPVIGQNKFMQFLKGEMDLSQMQVLSDNSCRHTYLVNVQDENLQKSIDVLSGKTKDAYLKLKPKLQQALGESFGKLDPLCADGDKRYQQILQQLGL